MSNKIIRKEDSLMSDISIVSIPVEMRKYQGKSIFGPSMFGYENPGNMREIEIKVQDIQKYGAISNISIQNSLFQNLQESVNVEKWIGNQCGKQQIGGVSEEQPQSEQAPVPVKAPKTRPRRTRKSKKQIKKLRGEIKNETKNIPKNFGKAIICFIEKSQAMLRDFIQSQGLQWSKFLSDLLQDKKKINTIADLRYLWLSSKYAKIMRVLSNKFLRQYGFHYVFNSRVSNITVHLKYRRRLADAIVRPEQFKHIKQY